MMLFDEWKNSIINKSINIDGVSGYQCVDVVHSYLKQCYDIPVTARGNAKDYWTAWETDEKLKSEFTRIKNTPDLFFLQGDIIIWNNAPYGHIAIATGQGNTSYFYSIDQNYSAKKVKQEYHTFKNVVGCLRPKRIFITAGKTYRLKQITGVYNDNFKLKTVSQLTPDGKKNATKTKATDKAYLKSKTKVTAQGSKLIDGNVWLKIPSGWLLVWHKNKHEVRIE